MTDFQDQQDPMEMQDYFDALDIGEMDRPDQTDHRARRDMKELSLAAFLRNIPDEGYRILMLMVEMLQELFNSMGTITPVIFLFSSEMYWISPMLLHATGSAFEDHPTHR